MDHCLPTKKRLLNCYLSGEIVRQGHTDIPSILTTFYSISYKLKAFNFGSKFTLNSTEL